jgi:hypothetical protein
MSQRFCSSGQSGTWRIPRNTCCIVFESARTRSALTITEIGLMSVPSPIMSTCTITSSRPSR